MIHVEKKCIWQYYEHCDGDADQTQDNDKAMLDLEEYSRHRKLNLQQLVDGQLRKLKASYTLSSTQRQDMCRWVQELKMSDGYVSNLCWCVNVAQKKFYRMKNHDCNVFMECLLSIA